MGCRRAAHRLLALPALAAVVGHTLAAVAARKYTVDLDAAPSTRWQHVLEDFLDEHGVPAFERTYGEWMLTLSVVLPDIFEPSVARANGERFVAALARSHPDLVGELRTLSQALRRRSKSPMFDLPFVAAATSVYVLGNISPRNTTDTRPHLPSACTSALVRGHDGHVLHGRSLDYEPRDPMAETAVEVEFTKRGVAAYTCLHPLVYPIALQWFTCVRPGQFSLSVNARGQGQWHEHNTTFDELLRRLQAPGSKLLGEASMAAMAADDYEAALSRLASLPVVSSNYFVLAGARVGEGAIVTRYGNSSSADVWALGSGEVDGQPSWMRVQTNVDHWVTYGSGAYATHRREHAIRLLSDIGEGNVTAKNLFGVYETASALDLTSLKRKEPEDTGAILRPSTIASLVMSPADSAGRSLGTCVWSSSPMIAPPSEVPAIPTCYGRATERADQGMRVVI
mmetsp:Transcript_115542/g.326617  ORF Transcript_115542/g.326617 Transcript_115542/m.326617 type:complete len:454 (+) Transcript_115542:52-1413(+)